jgi:hypothetical protein
MAKSKVNKLNHYDGFEVIDRFQIKRNLTCEHLELWMQATGVLNPTEKSILDNIRNEIKIHGRGWNEEELKIHFISFVFYLADINVPEKVYTFFERKLSGKV